MNELSFLSAGVPQALTNYPTIIKSKVKFWVMKSFTRNDSWKMTLSPFTTGLSWSYSKTEQLMKVGDIIDFEFIGTLANAGNIFGRNYQVKYRLDGTDRGSLTVPMAAYGEDSSPAPGTSGSFQVSMVWSPPTESGMGVRKVGDPSNVQINVTGMIPNSTFEMVNKNTNGTIIARTGPMGTGSNGIWKQFVNNPVPAVYIPGEYTAHIVHQGVSKQASRFKILSDVVEPSPPIDTGDPPPVGGGGGGGSTPDPTCPTEPTCPAGQKARPIASSSLIGGTGGCQVESWVCEDICVDPSTEWDPVTGSCVSIVDGGGGNGGNGGDTTPPDETVPPGDNGEDTSPPGGTGDDTPPEPTTPLEGSNLWMLWVAGALLLLASKKRKKG